MSSTLHFLFNLRKTGPRNTRIAPNRKSGESTRTEVKFWSVEFKVQESRLCFKHKMRLLTGRRSFSLKRLRNITSLPRESHSKHTGTYTMRSSIGGQRAATLSS